MTTHSIVIVTGPARAGKDSFVEFCKGHLDRVGIYARSFSSIAPVVKMLMLADIDLREKTPKDRELLANVGAALEEHSHFRTNHCLDECEVTRKVGNMQGQSSVTFLHIREPRNIDRVITEACKLGFNAVTTVFVSGSRAVPADNLADNAIHDITYGAYVENSGTLQDLRAKAHEYLMSLGLIPHATKKEIQNMDFGDALRAMH